MKRFLILAVVIFSLFSLQAVNFDAHESYARFQKGHSIGLSLFPVYESKSTLLELDAFGSFYFDMVSFGLLLPVRFIIYNGDDMPVSGSIFPEEDWDDARDWVSILSFFQYGQKSDLFYFRFSDTLNRYIGNGTILGGYYSDLKLRFPKRGVNLAVNTDYAGFDLFMDDVTPPKIIGGRAYIKPVSFFSKENYGNNLELGFTYFSDISAPYSTSINNDEGIISRDMSGSSQQVFGFDVSMRFVQLRYYKMKFYNEINHIVDAGTGLHFGLEHTVLIPSSLDMKLISRWEYRLMQSNYIPAYFNTFYDIQRENYRDSKPKSGFISSKALSDLDWTHGYYLDLVFDITGKFSIGGSFEHNRIYNSAATSKFDNFQINVFMNMLIMKKIGADITMTFEDIGEGKLADAPYFNVDVYYLLNDYFTIGFHAASKWYLRSEGEDFDTEYYYENTAVYSAGAYGMLRF